MASFDWEHARTLRLSGGLILDDIMRSLEDDDEGLDNHNEVRIAILPPTSACGDITDEGSGDQDNVVMDNLPGSQLRFEAEIIVTAEVELDREVEVNRDNGTRDEEDYHPLSQSKLACKKKYYWEKVKLLPEIFDWMEIHSVRPNFTVLELFYQMFDQ